MGNNMGHEFTGYPSVDKPWMDYYPQDVREKISHNVNSTMFELMHRENEQYKDDYALRYFGKNITFDEMFKKIDYYAKILKGYGVNRGDIVSLCLPNIPDTVYLKYALNKIGAVANMIDPRYNENSIVKVVNDSKSKLLITVLDVYKVKGKTIENNVKVDDILVLSISESLKLFDSKESVALKVRDRILKSKLDNYKKIKFLNEFEKWGKNESEVKPLYHENSPAVIFYTSGTTGVAKGALLTNEAYNTMHEQLQYVGDFRRQDTFFGAIPFFTAYGSFCGMHNSLCSGQQIIMIPKFVPSEVQKSIVKHKPNVSFLVPGYWETIKDSKEGQKEDFSYLRIVVAGGDKMSPASLEKVNKFLLEHGSKHKLRIGYGASEFGGAVSVVTEDEYYIPGSAGMVLPTCDVIIINPETEEEVKYNEVGEICVNSPTMMVEYLGNKEETDNITIYKNGKKYYKTGDKGYILENGVLFVIDRYKRLMKLPDGHQVFATTLENRIMEYPGVEKCCVVGLKYKNKSGVIPTAFIVVDKDKKKTFEIDETYYNLDNFCIEKLSIRDRVMAYVVVDDLPYNLMGKVDYRSLEKNKLEDVNARIVDDTFLKDENILILKKK